MQAMSTKKVLSLAIFQLILFATATALANQREEEASWVYDSVAKKDQQKTIASTEYGRISAVRVTDHINGSYLLHFFTLEPNALFLPVVLHADMVFYVNTGSGRLSWNEEDGLKHADLRPGDVYRLEQGTVFFLQSNLETETERRKLRFYAIFTNQDMNAPVTRPYSSIRDLVLGFDRKVLQAAFKVPEEVIDELMNGTEQPAIIHSVQESKSKKAASWEIIQTQLGFRRHELNKKKKKEGSSKLFNLFKERKDFENCNGWSTTVTRKKLSALKGSNIGLFMVNLTAGSMMGPHWNPKASEISVVLQGHGMIHVVCSSPSTSNETTATGAPLCSNARYEVEEGDVFVVPRYRPMAQMSFNNDTLVFVGFSTSTKKNHPQFLAGRASVLRTLDEDVLAASFGARNSTLVSQLLSAQEDSVILGCVSCAEEEKRVLEEEIEREREKAREREEEEARKREEERRREEEEARRREEERAKREEEERRQREQEEEEEKRRREEEEERERQRQQEEEREREEEAARERQREEEEEEARRREEEEKARQEEEEEEKKRQEEEAARERQRQEEAERQREQEEEEERRRREEEEEAGERQREREEEERSEGERAAEEEARREEEAAREQERETREQEEEEGGGGGGGGYEIFHRLTI